MPRRIQIRKACLHCRNKRAKCDSQNPCMRCANDGNKCVFDHTRCASKSELRAEVARLKKAIEEKNKLLAAVSSTRSDVQVTMPNGLEDGIKIRQVVLEELANDNSSLLEDAVPEGACNGEGATSNVSQVVCPPCSSHPPSSAQPCVGFGKRDLGTKDQAAASAPFLPTPTASSSHSIDGDANQLQTDTWTKTGWSVVYVQQLFDAVLTWDYLPFCLFCRAAFLEDYNSGLVRYCSSALVHALLALATRTMIEIGGENVSAPQGWSDSNALFDVAEELIRANGSLSKLPDIQALGILSIYQFSCGRETKAQELADAFAACIKDLCLQQSLHDTEDDHYLTVRATTYCGAVSLVRMLRLTTGDIFSPFTPKEEDFVSLDRSPCNMKRDSVLERSKELNHTLNAHYSTICRLQIVPAKIFQLTEWVYRLLATANLPGGEVTWSEVLAIYTKCLDWYEGFFTLLNAEGSERPFVLFIHMYYQFCLFCLFRPFAEVVPQDSDIKPRSICTQAAQSILALAQLFSRLFGLQRVPAFLPYFVHASGIWSLAAIEDGESMNAAHLHSGDNPYHSKIVTENESVSKLAVSDARLLLTELGSTNPAVASIAERMFWGVPN